MFDPRLTEVYQVGGEPYTFQDASGELAAMAIGASLWGLGNQMLENGATTRTQRAIGTRYNYFSWDVNSPIFPLVRATGLAVKNWHDLILVTQLGQRFYDETKGDYPHGNVYNDVQPYTPNDYRNNTRITYDPTAYNFFNAAVAMNTASAPPDYAAGPIWAIFDAEAVAREQWKVTPPHVDPDGYQRHTLAELAIAIKNPYQPYRWMAPPCKRRCRDTTPLWTPGWIGISASLSPSTRSGRGRFTPPGPRHSCTIHVRASGSTRRAR
jgi:hypothetical protein